MPESRGHGFKIRAFVDSDHAGNDLTRHSRTGFLVFLNSAPMFWSTKKQTSVQTSTYSFEFFAMKEHCECLRGLRHKSSMMGMPCEFFSLSLTLIEILSRVLDFLLTEEHTPATFLNTISPCH